MAQAIDIIGLLAAGFTFGVGHALGVAISWTLGAVAPL
jgi:hypothetical protein